MNENNGEALLDHYSCDVGALRAVWENETGDFQSQFRIFGGAGKINS